MSDWKPRLRAMEQQLRRLRLDRVPCMRCFPPHEGALVVLDHCESIPTCSACAKPVDRNGRALGEHWKAMLLPGGEAALVRSIPQPLT